MILIPGSFFFAKLVQCHLPVQNLRGMPDTHPRIHSFNQRCPIQFQLQSVLGVRSFYVECNALTKLTETLKIGLADLYCSIIIFFFSGGSRPSGKWGPALERLICFSY